MNKLLLILAALLMLSGCSGTLFGADKLGKIDAGVDLPPQPAECGIATPHAAVPVGVELRSILKRERQQKARETASKLACFQFNENVRTGFAR